MQQEETRIKKDPGTGLYVNIPARIREMFGENRFSAIWISIWITFPAATAAFRWKRSMIGSRTTAMCCTEGSLPPSPTQSCP